MEALRNYFERFIKLSDDEWQDFQICLTKEVVHKKNLILKKNEQCDFLAFVQKGIFRFYSFNDRLARITAFFFPGDFVTNYRSFLTGKLHRIRTDNGPEFIAGLTAEWSKMQGINFQYIQPGKPMQNEFIVRFNGTYRRNVLGAHLFETLNEARDITDEFVYDYNNHIPHDSLGGLSPVMFKQKNQILQDPPPEEAPVMLNLSANKLNKKSTFV